jgi:hypothetical protein
VVAAILVSICPAGLDVDGIGVAVADWQEAKTAIRIEQVNNSLVLMYFVLSFEAV